MWLVSQTGARRGTDEADSQEENARAAVCQIAILKVYNNLNVLAMWRVAWETINGFWC